MTKQEVSRKQKAIDKLKELLEECDDPNLADRLESRLIELELEVDMYCEFR